MHRSPIYAVTNLQTEHKVSIATPPNRLDRQKKWAHCALTHEPVMNINLGMSMNTFYGENPLLQARIGSKIATPWYTDEISCHPYATRVSEGS